MHRAGLSRQVAVSVATVVALLVVACDAGTRSSPGATAIAPPSVSLVPAVETSTPEPVDAPGELPPIGPPGSVPPPPEVSVEYAGPADNLAGFVSGYRAAFGVPELSEQQIADAGARLCTYLQRHADAAGVVDPTRALAEAEINEPGYPGDVWQVAFGLASATYCSEFTFELEGQG